MSVSLSGITTLAFVLLAALGPYRILAQRNEVGLLAGATVTPGVSSSGGVIGFDPSLAFTVEYDHAFFRTPVGSLLGGVDFSASPLDVKTNGGPPTAINQYAYIFLTPEIRYRGPSFAGVTPWVSVGGGYARFREGNYRNGQVNSQPGTNTGAAEFSGGVDLKPVIHLILPIGFRLEARDYLSGKPNYNISTPGGVQNNVVLSGGFVVRF
jgi:hypothetical protein